MKITIESTTKIIKADGIECRVWEGKTASGINVMCLIPRVVVKADQDCSQFEKELQEQRAPSEDAQVFPLSMIL